MPNAGELNETADDLDWLLHPPYWFVHGLPWPGGDLAEGAIAYAPIMIPRGGLSRDAYQILASADLIADRRHERVILFSDITRFLARGGTSWSQLGVDWQHDQLDMADGRFPALYLTISLQAYALICSPAVLSSPGSDLCHAAAKEDELNIVRRSLVRRLEIDWPQFMSGVVRSL
jgi:hypothetical protein